MTFVRQVLLLGALNLLLLPVEASLLNEDALGVGTLESKSIFSFQFDGVYPSQACSQDQEEEQDNQDNQEVVSHNSDERSMMVSLFNGSKPENLFFGLARKKPPTFPPKSFI